MVHSDSSARLVDIFVDALPLSKLGFTHAQHESQGRPPYHSGVLLKLYTYGYRHGLPSLFMHHQQKWAIY
jgi:transposase